MDGLASAGLLARLQRLPSRATPPRTSCCSATRAQYLATARRDVEAGRPYLSTGDTDVTPRLWDVAARAAGGVLNAVDAVLARRGAQRVLRGASAGPSRQRRARHGLLPVQQRRGGGALCAAAARRRAGADCGLGRAPRQRHAGHLLRGSRASSSSARTSGRSIPAPAARTRPARARARAPP